MKITNIVGNQEWEKAFDQKLEVKQAYLVKFDTYTPVSVIVNVDWTGDYSLPLTSEEVVQEALGYLEDVKIDLNEDDIYEIELTEFEVNPNPIARPSKILKFAHPHFVELAVGSDEKGYFVQTTDVKPSTVYSEIIEEGLGDFLEAMKIAKEYSDYYALKINIWNT